MMIQTASKYEIARHSFRKNFSEGIKPVDSRQPIPDELALQMIQELDVSKDALIGVYDAFLILTTHLIEAGYRNIVVLENTHKNLSQSQEKYYNSVENVCVNSGIKYYIPPMNNWSRCNMKFDVIIGNPPYQNDKKNGSGTGSGHSAIFLDFVEKSHNLLKDNGILSLITPSTIFCGSESKTKLMVGSKSIYSVNFIDFGINKYFKIGQDVCRWVASPKKSNVVTTIADGRQVNLNTTPFVVKDGKLAEIVDTLNSYQCEKLNFSFSGAYVFESVALKLKKEGVTDPKKVATDKSSSQTESNPYAVDFNGKIYYMKVKPSKYDCVRIFAPQLTNPKSFVFNVRTNCGNNGSTYTMEFDTMEEAQSVTNIINNPIYLWIINSLRIDGRLNKTFLNSLPITPIEKVLTPDQLSYIQSQL